MKVNLINNVMYESFDKECDLFNKIIDMICKSETNKIIYKGSPTEIAHSTIRKFIYKNLDNKLKPIKVKSYFHDTINNDTRDFCIIYKEKSS